VYEIFPLGIITEKTAGGEAYTGVGDAWILGITYSAPSAILGFNAIILPASAIFAIFSKTYLALSSYEKFYKENISFSKIDSEFYPKFLSI